MVLDVLIILHHVVRIFGLEVAVAMAHYYVGWRMCEPKWHNSLL